MSNIKLKNFAGIMPRTAAKLLKQNAAQVAHNCRLKSGRLEPVMQPLLDSAYPGGGRCRIRFSAGQAYVGLADNPKSLHLWRYKTTSEGVYVPEVNYSITGDSITNDGDGAFSLNGKTDVWAFHSFSVTFTAWGTGTYNLGFKYRTTGDFATAFSGAYFPGWAQKVTVRPLTGATVTLHDMNLVAIKSNASNAVWTAGSIVAGASAFTGETYLGSSVMTAITGASITAGSVVTVQFGTRIPAGLKLELKDFAATSSAALPTLDVNGEGEYWLSWSDDVAITSSTLADDEKARLWIAGKTGVSNTGGTATNVPAVIGMTSGAIAAVGCDASKIVIRPVAKTPYASAPAAVVKNYFDILTNPPVFTCKVHAGAKMQYTTSSSGDPVIINIGLEDVTETGTVSAYSIEDGIMTLTVQFPGHTASVTHTSIGSNPLMWEYGTVYRKDFRCSGVGVTNLSAVAAVFENDNGAASTISTSEAARCVGVLKSGVRVGELYCKSAKANGSYGDVTDYSFNPTITKQDIGSDWEYVATMTETVKPWTATVKIFLRFTEDGTYSTAVTWETYTVASGTIKFTDTISGYYTEYLATWVDDWGQESPPSPFTSQFYVEVGQYVEIAAASSPGATADKRRIYRTYSKLWRFVTELESDRSTVWVDNVKNSKLQDEMPTFENPPDDLDGLISLPGGFLCGFVKGTKQICFTEPYIPYSYPTKYRLTVDAEPVALAASGNDIFVLTKGFPYVITGSHPDVMNMQKLAFPQACVSRRGVTVQGGVVFYASHDGLCALAAGGTQKVITDTYFSRKDWQTLAPETMRLAAHDTAVFIFSERIENDIPVRLCTIIDFADKVSAVTTADEWAVALFSDVQADLLYYAKQVAGVWEIMAWGASDTPKTFKWRSKRFQGEMPLRLGAVRLTSDRYDAQPVDPLTVTHPIVRIYSGESPSSSDFAVLDGDSYVSVSLYDQRARRVPLLRPERVFEIEIEHNAPIDDLIIATGMEECKP